MNIPYFSPEREEIEFITRVARGLPDRNARRVVTCNKIATLDAGERVQTYTQEVIQ